MGLYHSHVLTLAAFPCVASNPYMGDLFVLRALSPPPCTYILCIPLHGSPIPVSLHSLHGFNSLHGELFTLRPLSTSSCTYIHYFSLHGSPPLRCTYISCIGDLFALRAQSYHHVPTLAAFLCVVSCVDPHHSHVSTLPLFIGLI